MCCLDLSFFLFLVPFASVLFLPDRDDVGDVFGELSFFLFFFFFFGK